MNTIGSIVRSLKTKKIDNDLENASLRKRRMQIQMDELI